MYREAVSNFFIVDFEFFIKYHTTMMNREATADVIIWCCKREGVCAPTSYMRHTALFLSNFYYFSMETEPERTKTQKKN